MPGNTFSIPGLITTLFFAVVAVLILIRLAKSLLAPVRTVKAVVVDKHTTETFSKYSGNGKHIRYVVVFLADGKRLPFYVSEFSYNGYRLRERGTLTYRGDRLLSFE